MRRKIGFTVTLFLAILTFTQTSCMESKKAVASTEVKTEVDQLLFVNLLFLKTPDGKDSCKLINSIVAEGILRANETPHAKNKESYYTLFFNSCAGKTLYKEEMDNQLDTQMEVYTEGGAIELKNVSFKQKEYSIRMQKGKEKICRMIVTKTEKGQTETICNHLISL